MGKEVKEGGSADGLDAAIAAERQQVARIAGDKVGCARGHRALQHSVVIWIVRDTVQGSGNFDHIEKRGQLENDALDCRSIEVQF